MIKMTKQRWEFFYIVALWILVIGGIVLNLNFGGDPKVAEIPPPVVETSPPTKSQKVIAEQVAPPKAALQPQKVTINSPVLGWLRIRKKASVQAPEVGRVNHGTQLVFLKQDKGWHQVVFQEDKKGWVLGKYVLPGAVEVKKVEAGQSLPKKTIQEMKQPKKEKRIQVNSPSVGWLRVRQEPSLKSQEVGRVNHGEQFKIQRKQTGWYQIQFASGKQGWVSSLYIKELL
jgi:SH3-like domain-containing protein